MPSDLTPAEQVTRLRRQLRDTRADLRAARAELGLRPPAETGFEDLEPDDIRCLHAQFAPPTGEACRYCQKLHPGPCQTCGGLHGRSCPRIRSVEYQTQGDRIIIKRVDYWRKWPTDGIIFADQLPAEPEG